MAWTLSLILVILSIVLVTYLHRGIQKLRKRAFVYPSEAVIDQLLPPEVIEQIFLYSNYNSIMACSLVSKYWHYHASKEHVQEFVFRNDTSLCLNSDELKEDYNIMGAAHRFNLETFTPLTYSSTYPPKFRVADQYFAKRLYRRLIETNLRTARNICHVMNYNDRADPSNDQISKYLVKLQCKLRYGWTNYWSLEDIASTFTFTLNDSLVPDCSKYEFTEGLECDVIVDLNTVLNDRGDFTNGIRRLRVLDNRPQIAGFPFSSVLIQLIILLMVPCLFVDYTKSTAYEVKFYVKVLITLAFEFFAIFLSTNEHVPTADITPATKRKRRIVITSGLSTVLIGAVFYRWNLELAIYVAMLGGSAVYYLLWENFVFKKYNHAKLVGFIAVCLVILMNDWKLTVDAFKSGEILWTFGYNIIMHMQLGVIFTLHNALTTYLYGSRRDWQDYLKWRAEYKDMYLYGLIALVFITLYAPTTTRKIF